MCGYGCDPLLNVIIGQCLQLDNMLHSGMVSIANFWMDNISPNIDIANSPLRSSS